MEFGGSAAFVLIPIKEFELLKGTQQEILKTLVELKSISAKVNNHIPTNCITALEFMDAVRIRRSKFDELVANNKIKSIKKKRKIYVPVTEIERYFSDPTIE